MEAPPVQYVKTSDGYDIAYTERGSGPVLVCMPFMFSHAQSVWQASSATLLLQALSARFRVVYYDGRGQGLSERGLPADTTLASFHRDLEAVLDKLGSNRPILFADGPRCLQAVRFAAHNPARVRALALMHCAPAFPSGAAMAALAKADWDYFLSVEAGMNTPRSPQEAELLMRRKEGLRARTTQQDHVRLMEIFLALDITDTLQRLRVPALVLHPSHQQWVDQDTATRSAALIPNGRLVVLSNPSFFGDEEAADAIERLLSETPAVADGTASEPARTAQDLSARELEVLRMLAKGRSNKEIAAGLTISLNTVTRHVSNIFAKIGVENRTEAAAYAHRQGLA
jgi:DNA-binding CsgD family transcriptional regulator/pimeloyl-ACP methyl ester carboxylesterase